MPKKIREQLPNGWNNHMFWFAFRHNGEKFYYDYYTKLKKPKSYKPKVAVKDKYKLSEEDIRSFYVNGYVKPFKVMETDEAEKMQKHLANLINHKKTKIHDTYSYEDSGLSKEALEFMQKRVNVKNRHLEDPYLLDLFTRPQIIERCAQLLGEDLLLWRSSFFPVGPKTKGTEWHQASTFLLSDRKESIVKPPDTEDLFQVTFWVALTDATLEKACLKTVSHSQWEIRPSKYTSKSNEINTNEIAGGGASVHGKYEAEYDYPILPKDINYIEAKAGECIIFSERAIHGSVDNQTDEWRWAASGRIVKTNTALYNERMFKEGDSIGLLGVKNMNLDKWRAILVRGEDTYGHNRLATKEELPSLESV